MTDIVSNSTSEMEKKIWIIDRLKCTKMKTLLINSHSDFNCKERFSNKLQKLFLEKYNQKFDKNELTI